jgi:hypothetical protein
MVRANYLSFLFYKFKRVGEISVTPLFCFQEVRFFGNKTIHLGSDFRLKLNYYRFDRQKQPTKKVKEML